jgi:hypothetical protein
LAICPYCKTEYKKITANHLAKHNINYLNYLEKYEGNKYYEKVVSEFIWDFYRPCSSKYIEQVYSTELHKYIWITKYAMYKDYLNEKIRKAYKESKESHELDILLHTRNYPFGKADIVKHLRKETTIGIYTYQRDTTFLTFDIDVDNMHYVQGIYDSLRRCKIDDNQILISWSGNKGYHISIFFDKPILKFKVEKFFNLVIWASFKENALRDNGSKVIEARGISNQGVKIPLSINRKNKIEYRSTQSCNEGGRILNEGKGNYCFLINRYGREINTLIKIKDICKIESGIIEKSIEDLSSEKEFYDNIGTALTRVHNDTIINANIKATNNNVEDIKKRIETKLNKPIEAKNRHNTLLELAVLNKSNGMTAVDNKTFLINFTADKNMNHKFETKMDANIKEIESLIKTIYYSKTADKYQISNNIKDLYFTKGEILEILSIKDKHLRKFYFKMFIQYKMFGNKIDRHFFLTYESIKKHLI